MEMMEKKDIEGKVLGALMNKPSNLLGSEIKLEITDFTDRLNRIIFGAVSHLVNNGIIRITANDVDECLKPYAEQYEFYKLNSGNQIVGNYIINCDVNNFNYYYKTLKKVALINYLIEKGFDVSPYYQPDETDIVKRRKTTQNFENASVEDILGYFDTLLTKTRDLFTSDQTKISAQAGDNLEYLVEELKETPEMGMPMNSYKLNTIFRGRRRKKLYLFSSIQGGGKSRIAMGDAGRLALTEIYNPMTKEWEKNNNPQPTLYISTEMELEEIQTLILAYASGINEEKILDGVYSLEELGIITKAIQVVKESPLYFDYISNFNIEDIEECIKTHKQQHNIQAVFFDYIHLNIKFSSSVSQKMGLSNNREDIVLLMFADRLKAIANDYDIHIHTSTQLNGEWEKKETPNQNLLRGSKAIADKGDVGAIVLPITAQDEQVLAPLLEEYENKPNMVIHIYKNRRGKWKNIKVFVYFDYGTCRMYDCFVTDRNNNLIAIDDTIIQ